MPFVDLFSEYISLGFNHVIPLGFDHILFILCIFFLNSELKSVLLQSAVFTIAHSLTLGLTACGWILPNSYYVEVLISLSILLTALENLIHSKVNTWRILVIFLFGLIHGMGFASVLTQIGIPKENFILTVLFFNLGVEFAQIVILTSVYYLIAKYFSLKPWYKARIVYPISTVIACIAIFWTIQRLIS